MHDWFWPAQDEKNPKKNMKKKGETPLPIRPMVVTLKKVWASDWSIGRLNEFLS